MFNVWDGLTVRSHVSHRPDDGDYEMLSDRVADWTALSYRETGNKPDDKIASGKKSWTRRITGPLVQSDFSH